MVFTNPGVVLCTHCGSENSSVAIACERCGKELTIYIGPVRGRSYSLGSIMLLIGAVSVGLAACRVNAVLGGATLALIIPAIGRTLYYQEKERAWSTPMHPLDVLGLFIESLVLMMLQLVFICIVFGVTLALISALLPSPRGWIVAMISATGITLWAGGWMASKTLPRRP